MTNSIADALHLALAAKWASDDKAHQEMEQKPEEPQGRKFFQVTNNLTRATFDQIKEHPDTRPRITSALVERGYQYNSVSAIIGHMIKGGLVAPGADGVLRALSDEYRPIKAKDKRKPSKPVKLGPLLKAKMAQQAQAPRQAPAAAPAPRVVIKRPVSEPSAWSVRSALEGLSVLQARELFDELKKIFGEAK